MLRIACTWSDTRLQWPCVAAAAAAGCIEELLDCSGGDEISLESGTARKLEAMMEALDRVRCAAAVTAAAAAAITAAAAAGTWPVSCQPGRAPAMSSEHLVGRVSPAVCLALVSHLLLCLYCFICCCACSAGRHERWYSATRLRHAVLWRMHSSAEVTPTRWEPSCHLRCITLHPHVYTTSWLPRIGQYVDPSRHLHK
jgi:hypothetical protein